MDDIENMFIGASMTNNLEHLDKSILIHIKVCFDSDHYFIINYETNTNKKYSFIYESNNYKKYTKTLKYISNKMHTFIYLTKIIIQPVFDFDDYKTDINLINLKYFNNCSPPKTLKEILVIICLVEEDDYDEFASNISDDIVDFLYDNDIYLNIVDANE